VGAAVPATLQAAAALPFEIVKSFGNSSGASSATGSIPNRPNSRRPKPLVGFVMKVKQQREVLMTSQWC
jgi:hypothetical protein